MSRRIASAVLAFVLALSLVAPALGGALAGSAAAAPSGMVTVADSQITQEVPEGESIPVSAADLEGAVLASSGHADSLEVIATTPGHADEVMGTDANVVGGGQMALVFRDAEDHESREIAVDAGLLREALGYTPETVRGTHSSGETWRSEATYEDGSLVMTIESFSSNTVTFSGEVDVSMTGATNGTSAQWELSDYDSASDVTINTTGVTNSETESASATLTDGDSLSLDVAGTTAASDASVTFNGRSSSSWHNVSGSDSPSGQFSPSIGGNLDPTGPGSNNKPVLEVTAHHGSTSSYNPVDTHGDGTNDQGWNIAGDDSNNAKTWIELRVQPDASGEVTELTVNIDRVYGNEYNPNVDVYMVHETPDTTQGEGTLVKENWNPSWTTGTQTVTLDTPYKIQSGQDYTIEFVTTNSDGDDTGDYLDIATDDSASSVWVMSDSLGGTTREDYADIGLKITQPVNDLSVGGDVSASFGDFADSET
ncbi:hypothetical protein RBH22_06895, partial [Halobellus sp. H-GB7]|nr:hypothetical protein [Halobellus sp. H-GB7]